MVKQGIVRLEDNFESRALGLREQARLKGPFESQIAAALPVLKAGTAALDEFFQSWDVMLSPVLREPVFKTGMRDQRKFSFYELDDMLHDYVAYTSLHNICGTPAMSVPFDWDTSGLPLGVQFATRAGGEGTRRRPLVEPHRPSSRVHVPGRSGGPDDWRPDFRHFELIRCNRQSG